MTSAPCTIGIDIGTSGVRAVVVDESGRVVAKGQEALPPPERRDGVLQQDPALWWEAVDRVMLSLGTQATMEDVDGICIDGTSGTIMICDRDGVPLAPARMYNDQSAVDPGQRIDAVAPRDSMARGTGGSLARLMALVDEVPANAAASAQHQADWVAAKMTGKLGLSDYNNCLKLGYDVADLGWPDWMIELGFDLSLLPKVGAPGAPLGQVMKSVAVRYALRPSCRVVHGTTDGNAAFLAAGSFEPGTAVTSLGSTLTLKLASKNAVSAPEFGVYSHRLLGHWLAGGASNSGGAAIARFFSPEDIERLTPYLQTDKPTGLDYYPLPSTGERFPHADPTKAPVVDPRPEDDAVFLQGLLEGVAQIERDAYAQLAELGATPVKKVLTVGGGAANKAWTAIRQRVLGVPVTVATHTQAAYGAARLAQIGLMRAAAQK